ncbi:hypothetical protein KIN20_008053 [Parelaphostrongylus tenuis]|uniref:PiggyBac transposable element-derived protein domain-containing protein n=1 Tax=Parelaphostrongylus tenuis TaxID=148309 RepID=A0AAD5MPX4_PARTN|nr:hypothetical protein KIN20_008053 [Parelaphostrongylus tenuis]
MSAVRLPRLNDYWSARQGLVGVSMAVTCHVHATIFDIVTHLHVAGNRGYKAKDMIYKIKVLVELVNYTCKTVYRQGKDVCINESRYMMQLMIQYRGKTRLH